MIFNIIKEVEIVVFREQNISRSHACDVSKWQLSLETTTISTAIKDSNMNPINSKKAWTGAASSLKAGTVPWASRTKTKNEREVRIGRTPRYRLWLILATGYIVCSSFLARSKIKNENQNGKDLFVVLHNGQQRILFLRFLESDECFRKALKEMEMKITPNKKMEFHLYESVTVAKVMAVIRNKKYFE